MALNIKNAEVEQLAAELAALEKISKTEAIRRALQHQKQRLLVTRVTVSKGDRLRAVLRDRIWPEIPPAARRPLSKKERERILGYEAKGV